jgi:hypothetical protein
MILSFDYGGTSVTDGVQALLAPVQENRLMSMERWSRIGKPTRSISTLDTRSKQETKVLAEGCYLTRWSGFIMRSGATCHRRAFFLLLLVVSLMSSGGPIVYARTMPRVGEILLTPTHAVPGTLVHFQGVGWYLPSTWNYGYGPPLGPYIVCQVNGEPVKIDSHAICNVMTPSGMP